MRVSQLFYYISIIIWSCARVNQSIGPSLFCFLLRGPYSLEPDWQHCDRRGHADGLQWWSLSVRYTPFSTPACRKRWGGTKLPSSLSSCHQIYRNIDKLSSVRQWCQQRWRWPPTVFWPTLYLGTWLLPCLWSNGSHSRGIPWVASLPHR